MSPLVEESHALVRAVARDIEAGVGEEKLERWYHIMLSMSTVFKVLDSDDDAFFYSITLRQRPPHRRVARSSPTDAKTGKPSKVRQPGSL